MNTLLRSVVGGSVFLVAGTSVLAAQEVTFTAGPAITPATPAWNRGFCRAGIDSSGTIDLFNPPNNYGWKETPLLEAAQAYPDAWPAPVMGRAIQFPVAS